MMKEVKQDHLVLLFVLVQLVGDDLVQMGLVVCGLWRHDDVRMLVILEERNQQ